MGGGAEYFLPNAKNGNVSQYPLWAAKNYTIVHDNSSLAAAGNDSPLLGTFTQGNMAVWLDRNVEQFKPALNDSVAWNGTQGTFHLPGLKEMTIKAIDVLSARSKAHGDTGFMLMSFVTFSPFRSFELVLTLVLRQRGRLDRQADARA